jgi:hypothetical protein
MELYRQNYAEAVRAADVLLNRRNFANSMASIDEVKFLKGLALEKSNRKAEASRRLFLNSRQPFFVLQRSRHGKTRKLNGNAGEIRRTASVSTNMTRDYPVMYRTELLRSRQIARHRPAFRSRHYETGIELPRRREIARCRSRSSPARLRHRRQIQPKAGYNNFQADDLYQPAVNIAIGSVYIAELKNQFGGMYEAIAASYNGGEDNAARWLERSRPRESGVFASGSRFRRIEKLRLQSNEQLPRLSRALHGRFGEKII